MKQDFPWFGIDLHHPYPLITSDVCSDAAGWTTAALPIEMKVVAASTHTISIWAIACALVIIPICSTLSLAWKEIRVIILGN